MKITFQLRGKTVTISKLDDVVALRPSAAARSATRAAGKLAARFHTAQAADDTRGGRFGVQLPAKNRGLYEKAGWLFVDAREPLTRAAATRGAVADADAVRPVFVNRSGLTLVGTELVTVRTADRMTEAQLLEELKRAGLRLVRRLGFAANLVEARLPAKVPFAEAVAAAQGHKNFEFAEPSFLQPLGGRGAPSDAGFKHQWQHANSGANGGKKGADIKTPAAWAVTEGAGVRVAVIDNGMQVKHPDLKAGVTGGGHFEADGQGNATFVPRAGNAAFPGGHHGTFCMGMAGARRNGKGVVGSAPAAGLIPVACLPDQVGTQTTLARAVAYAADPTTEDPTATAAAGADVIACSLGPNGPDWEMASVLDLAIRAAAVNGRGGRGVPILWAVSNGPFEVALDEVSSHELVLGVGRSNRNDLEDGSAFGPRLAFLAPGRDVYSTTEPGKYGFDTGTSYACPLAAGVAALVLAKYPTWTREQVAERLKGSCDKVGGVTYDATGHHDEYGHGRVNAQQAVQ